MANVIHNRFHANLFTGDVDFETDDIKVALMKETYTPAKADNVFADVSADELEAGNGYTAGGASIPNLAVTQGDSTNVDGDNVDWSDSTFEAFYAVLYNASLTDDDLVCSFDFEGGKEVSAGTFRIVWDDQGILQISQAA